MLIVINVWVRLVQSRAGLRGKMLRLFSHAHLNVKMASGKAERKADLKKVKELIDRVLHDNYANLKEILETEALTRFCSRLYSDNAVTSTSVSNPCFNTIMKEFKAKCCL